MKKSMSKFTAIVLLITVLTVIALAGTYAKYTSSFSGSGTVTTANWNVSISDDGTTYKQTGLELNISDKIYPGGSNDNVGTITVKNNSNLVNATVRTMELTNVAIDGTTITSTHPLYQKLTLSVTPVDATTNTIAPNGGTKAYNVSYAWDYGASRNDNDYAGKTITFDVTLIVDQSEN